MIFHSHFVPRSPSKATSLYLASPVRVVRLLWPGSARIRGSRKLWTSANQREAHRNYSCKADYQSASQGSTTVMADVHEYTSGRWLNQQKENAAARYVRFDFAALCAKAVELCSGAQSVASHRKIEGGYNKVFVFTMDNGQKIVARLPTSISGPSGLTTNSEVATIAYVRSRTKIPVPRVLEWRDTSSNPIGSEYIFMEPVGGVPLHTVWRRMSSSAHLQMIKSIVNMMAQLTNLDFPAYGSLYFSDAPLPGHQKQKLADGFCIGPHCGSTYWNCGVGESSIYKRNNDQGSWPDLVSYCRGLVASARSRIPDLQTVQYRRLPFQGSVHDHLELLQDCEAVMRELIKSPLICDIAKPTLLHADLHQRNIFVSEENPEIITAVIDWQSTSIEPAFVYAAETPDFADTGLPSTNRPSSTVGEVASHQQKSADIDLCRRAFEVCVRGYCGVLGKARAVDEDCLRPFLNCTTTWRNGSAGLRNDLIELSKCWKVLGLPGDCPYQPSHEEIERHNKQYEDFDAVQQLKLWMIQNLKTDSDGWIPADSWDTTLPAYRAALEQWLDVGRQSEAAGDPDMSLEKAEKMWPFDQR